MSRLPRRCCRRLHPRQQWGERGGSLSCGIGTDHSTSQPNNNWISRSRSVFKFCNAVCDCCEYSSLAYPARPHFLSTCLGVSTRVLMFNKIHKQALYNFEVQLICSNLPPTCSKSELTSRRLVGFEPGWLIFEFPIFAEFSGVGNRTYPAPHEVQALNHCTNHAFLHLFPLVFWRVCIKNNHKLSCIWQRLPVIPHCSHRGTHAVPESRLGTDAVMFRFAVEPATTNGHRAKSSLAGLALLMITVIVIRC